MTLNSSFSTCRTHCKANSFLIFFYLLSETLCWKFLSSWTKNTASLFCASVDEKVWFWSSPKVWKRLSTNFLESSQVQQKALAKVRRKQAMKTNYLFQVNLPSNTRNGHPVTAISTFLLPVHHFAQNHFWVFSILVEGTHSEILTSILCFPCEFGLWTWIKARKDAEEEEFQPVDVHGLQGGLLSKLRGKNSFQDTSQFFSFIFQFQSTTSFPDGVHSKLFKH